MHQFGNLHKCCIGGKVVDPWVDCLQLNSDLLAITLESLIESSASCCEAAARGGGDLV